MRRTLLASILLLQGCSLLTDFDKFGSGKAQVQAPDAQTTNDAGEIFEPDASVEQTDAAQAPDTDAAGELLPDAGSNQQDAAEPPPDAAVVGDSAVVLPPLGPATTADLPRETAQQSEECGSTQLFQTKWPRSTTSEDPSCPEWLTQTGVLTLTRDFGSGASFQCDWLGEPEGVTFSADGVAAERKMFAQWSGARSGFSTTPYRMTVIWRGLLCVYKAGSEL